MSFSTYQNTALRFVWPIKKTITDRRDLLKGGHPFCVKFLTKHYQLKDQSILMYDDDDGNDDNDDDNDGNDGNDDNDDNDDGDNGNDDDNVVGWRQRPVQKTSPQGVPRTSATPHFHDHLLLIYY